MTFGLHLQFRPHQMAWASPLSYLMCKSFSISLLSHWSIVNLFFRYKSCTVYELFPQSETPELTLIAHLDYDLSTDLRVCILPGTVKVIWYSVYGYRIVFMVWDYRLNHSMSFTVDVVVKIFENYPQV